MGGAAIPGPHTGGHRKDSSLTQAPHLRGFSFAVEPDHAALTRLVAAHVVSILHPPLDLIGRHILALAFHLVVTSLLFLPLQRHGAVVIEDHVDAVRLG